MPPVENTHYTPSKVASNLVDSTGYPRLPRECYRDNATVNLIRVLGISPVAELPTLTKNSSELCWD
jgi:hypothetical protein